MSTRVGFPVLARRAGVLALLGVSFSWGFFIEVSDLFDDVQFWPGLVALVFPLIIVLTIATAAAVGREKPLLVVAVAGVAFGTLGGMLFVVGVFSPFALGFGERDLVSFSGEFEWSDALSLA